MKVCKFGGSSLAEAGQVRKVCDIVLSDKERRLVVVSAPGKRFAGDTKVTDLLIACAETALLGKDFAPDLERVVERFRDIEEELDLDPGLAGSVVEDLNRRLDGRGNDRAQFLDAMKAAGEDNAARLVAAALRRAGADAAYVGPAEAGLLLTEEHGNAVVLPESYQNLRALADRKGITVFPGFFGHTRKGNIVTFSRGGSDITGSVLAAAVKAELYENFTDVDSVFRADPRIVPGAECIEELSFHEMRELSYAGFGVLHDEAIIPAVSAGIPICIKNTNRPDAPGTLIVPRRLHGERRVVGIASDEGFGTVYISKYLMNREIGFGRRLLQIVEEEGLSYEHTPSGIDNMSVIVREKDLTPEVEKRLLSRIRKEMGAEDVEVERGLALIMVVGEGMRFTVGLAARATRAMADAGVNIEMMNQGSSEISMMFGVKAQDRKRAVESLYRVFFAPGA